MDVFIYALQSPINSEIFYVGKTINMNTRYLNHISCGKRAYSKPILNSNINIYINNLLIKDLKPKMILLEVCSSENWEEKEKYWILFYSNQPLCNRQKGGEMSYNSIGLKRSNQTKLRLSLSKRGEKNPMFGNSPNDLQKKSLEDRRKEVSKSVILLESPNNEEKIYNSINEAARDLKLDSSAIYRVCERKYKHTKGFKFKYKN